MPRNDAREKQKMLARKTFSTPLNQVPQPGFKLTNGEALLRLKESRNRGGTIRTCVGRGGGTFRGNRQVQKNFSGGKRATLAKRKNRPASWRKQGRFNGLTEEKSLQRSQTVSKKGEEGGGFFHKGGTKAAEVLASPGSNIAAVFFILREGRINVKKY